ncbi:HlyD family efflux transporter periplasmic adaptor subunit [Microbulbifer sp. SAOS-129_SWC]|uniref:efflux RND transporter periplasmic adaptor subunit n=1 Tax=Microbulbifer sp. SAOS-129_SWC TaxID=3145235 RepID=UPI0032180F05
MSASAPPGLLEKLNAFLALEKRLRGARSVAEIARIACCDCQALLRVDSCVYFRKPDLRALAAANVADVDNTSAEIHHFRSLLRGHAPAAGKTQVECATEKYFCLVAEIGQFGRLLFVRATPFAEHEQEIQRELAAAMEQALLARRGAARRPWHMQLARRKTWFALFFFGVCLLPVRQSVLAPATLAAIDPRIVSAKTEGVVRSIAVAPNTRINKGDLLFTLESAEVEAEIGKVKQEISLYSERLRMTRQYNFQESSAGHRLAQAQTDLAIRRLDLDYQQDLLQKTRVRAPESGVAIFTEPSEWIGRRVRAGEKVMEIVRPDARQIQVDLPTTDAIPLPERAQAIFYAEADPLAPIRGRVRYQSLLTAEGEDLPASYRVIAQIEEDQRDIRINTKGYARLYGARVPLIYFLLRRPLANMRRWLGV